MAVKNPEIIAYGYELAPNPQKLFQFLAFFGIPYKYVEIPVTMPRPGFAEIGITYRRSPLLSIDSDMYIDNSLIISRLSDIAQHSNSRLDDTTNHLEFDSLGQQAFQLAIGLLPMDLPWIRDEAFVADRTDLMGREIDFQVVANARPITLSKMISFIQLIEGHFLKGDRKFIRGGSQPSTADMHLYWGLNYGLRYHHGAQPEISSTTYPKIFGWLNAVKAFIEPRELVKRISMEDAKAVLQLPPKHEDAKFVPHVDDNLEKLSPGQKVKVTPEDIGKSGPQVGKLISLNYEQVCLRNERGLVMHFPRMGYEIVAVGPL